ncbi:MAG: YfhO family protein, partial [Oscillospiraceae bacterium]
MTNPQHALIGGLLYAFSGYSMYNIFFNHFHEAIVFFPLLLIGLEESVVNKRRGALAAAVAINAFVNDFFFIGECVFLLLYFVIRLIGD